MTVRFRAFSWGAIDAVGPDGPGWLSGIVTCDVPASSVGGARWGLLLSKQGKVQAELVLTRPDSSTLQIAVRGGDADQVSTALEHHLVMEDVELGPVRSVSWAVLLGVSSDDLPRLAAASIEVCAFPAPFGSETTALVRSDSEPAQLVQALAQVASELSAQEWDDARVDLGLPTFGVDYDALDNPHQASLERRAVSWQKGCYLGQEVVFMQDARGKVKRRLVKLSWAPGGVTLPGAVVKTAAGEEVGRVTTVGVGQGLARVNAPHFELGTALLVDELPVVVAALDSGLFGRAGAADRVPK
jgi:folate-binding protein YgfZ